MSQRAYADTGTPRGEPITKRARIEARDDGFVLWKYDPAVCLHWLGLWFATRAEALETYEVDAAAETAKAR